MCPHPSREAAIAAIAARQHGNVTRAQLIEAGFYPRAISRRVRAGGLHRVYTGVYSVGRAPVTPIERASAAVLACGPTAALSHASALTLWEIDKRWHSPFEVTVVKDRRPAGIRTHRARTLDRRDVTVQLGITATTLARTLLDMAPRLSERKRRRAVNDALYSPYMSDGELADVLARNPNHRGAALLRPLIADTQLGITRSELEDMLVQLCKRYDLPIPSTNVKLRGGYVADAYFPGHGLIVELDSWQFHRGRISFEVDRDRDADNLAAGLSTIRITHDRMQYEPAKEAARLRRILDQLVAEG